MRERPNLFDAAPDRLVGLVGRVDSYSVTVYATDDRQIRNVAVNGYVILNTADPNTRLIGRIGRVVRLELEERRKEAAGEATEAGGRVSNEVTIQATGTLKGPGGGRSRAAFARSVEQLPEIGARCYLLTGEYLAAFAGLIADETAKSRAPLTLGAYTMAPEAAAVLDGNAFFQRHAMIVGSTGSGKSWTVAALVEQVAELERANLIVFDLHGEYEPLAAHPRIARYRIAGPGDLDDPGKDALFLPYWLLGYEDMLALILDRSDENAPNQAMAFSRAVVRAKREALSAAGMAEELETFTIDSPVPYDLDAVAAEIANLNEERVQGRSGLVNGPFHGKFSRFLARLAAKRSDRRYGFMFALREEQRDAAYLDALVRKLMRAGSPDAAGVKIVDFSEVPSDMLPIAIGLTARLIFQVQLWSGGGDRHPIALVCDEAHLYLPGRSAADATEARALAHFERIAKEGRKYGVGLVAVSQRPSELNATVMSQCHNIVALRLSHPADQSAVAGLLPEALGGIRDMLPLLGVGEAVVVGDACLLPSRIQVREPAYPPRSGTVKFWDEWSRAEREQKLAQAVRSLRRQSSPKLFGEKSRHIEN